MENSKEITITRTFNAPRERVWKAWTDPKELAMWWGPFGVTNPTSEIDLRVGGTIYIVMLAGKELGPLAGQRWPMKGTFKEIIEHEKIVFVNQAIDEQGTVLLDGLTTILFEDDNGKTKLTVIASAKGMAPQAPQMLAGMEMGWTQSIDKLEKYIG